MRNKPSRPHQAPYITLDVILDDGQRPITIQIDALNEDILSHIARELRGAHALSLEETAQEVFQCALAEWRHIVDRIKDARDAELYGDVPALIAFKRKAEGRLRMAIREEITV